MQRGLGVIYKGKKPELPSAGVEGRGLWLAELSACPTDPRWGLGSVCSEPDTAGGWEGAAAVTLWKREQTGTRLSRHLPVQSVCNS